MSERVSKCANACSKLIFVDMVHIELSLLMSTLLIRLGYCLPVGNFTMSKRNANKENMIRIASYYTLQASRPAPVLGWGWNTHTNLRPGEGHFILPNPNNPNYNFQPQMPQFKYEEMEKPPSCAKGSTFCEKVEDYPGNYVETIIPNTINVFLDMLGVDKLESQIKQRIDDNAANENSLCPSVEEIVFPKRAKNLKDQWLYVVNHAGYIQGVRIEKCLKTSDSAAQNCYFTESFPDGYKTTCKQKYIYRKLVAINAEGIPVTDTFQLPSCCSCVVTSEGIGSRHGALLNSSLISTTSSKPQW